MLLQVQILGVCMQGLKQSRYQQAWKFGRHVYRFGALGWSAFQMYQNP
jgi:hypothetical protein